MASYCKGYGLYGTGTNAGVAAELLSLGAMDAYLIKGASVTFFRFRYAKYSNFAMEAVGQRFLNQPTFGGHSEIILDRNGDLLSHMYVVIDLPGITACKRRRDVCNFDCAPCCNNDIGIYPAVGKGGCAPCINRDRQYFVSKGQSITDCTVDCECAEKVGYAYWKKTNYGGCYNPKFDDCSTVCGESLYSGECPISDECEWVHWTNAVGQFLVQRAVLVVSGHKVDELYSDYLFMWEELSGKAGKRLREMIGKRKTRKQLIRDAREEQRLYVPLPFYFTQHYGNALAFCNVNFNGVRLHVEWGRLQDALVTSCPDVQVVKCCDNTILTSNDLNAWIDTTFIHLDLAERNKFSLSDFDQLITQVQVTTYMSSNTCQVTVPLNFNHPVIELIWAVRRCCNERKNNWFDYSGIDGRDPISQVDLRLNNLQRFGGRQGRYYRLVQPYQYHSSIPKAYVYNYSFSLYPEEPQPSGSINFSRIENVEMTFCLQDGLGCEQVRIIVFARNYNLLRYVQGTAGILFR